MRHTAKAKNCCLLISVLTITTTGAQEPSHPKPLTLVQTRELLKQPSPHGMLGNVSLQGLVYSRELELGAGLRLILLSKDRSGGLALFSAEGVLADSISSGEFTWIQLFDLNGDGISEVITEEIAGRGTGVLIKDYNFYAIVNGQIKKLWQRRSYNFESLWSSARAPSKGQESKYFLRFDGPAAGIPARMTYLEPVKADGPYRESVYIMNNWSVQLTTSGRVGH